MEINNPLLVRVQQQMEISAMKRFSVNTDHFGSITED